MIFLDVTVQQADKMVHIWRFWSSEVFSLSRKAHAGSFMKDQSAVQCVSAVLQALISVG